MSVDTIGNFLTIIRNGLMRSKPSVLASYSRMNEEIAKILKAEGFIKDFEVIQEDPSNPKKSLKIYLKYVDGESVIHELKRISTPGLRRYRGADQIQPVIGNLGISIITTSKGVMTDKQAKELGIGGEVVCSVW